MSGPGEPIPDSVRGLATVLQRQAIDAVNAAGGNRTQAARDLGLDVSTLRDRVRKALAKCGVRDTEPEEIPEPKPLAKAVPRQSPYVLGGSDPNRFATGRARTTFVISDMHVPYHDPQVWACMLAIIRHLRPENVVIIGDFLDCYAASRFTKDPERRTTLLEEVAEGDARLDDLEFLRVPNVIFTEGNHETRISRAIAERAPELHGIAKTVPELLHIERRGWTWVNYKSSISIGKMRYSHDFSRCGVNATRQSLVDVGRSITFGHTHRLGVAYQGTIEDGSHVSLNVGWGGLVSAIDYRHRDMARRDFQHGCGIVDEDERGFVWPQAVAILDGSAMVRGQRVTA